MKELTVKLQGWDEKQQGYDKIAKEKWTFTSQYLLIDLHRGGHVLPYKAKLS